MKKISNLTKREIVVIYFDTFDDLKKYYSQSKSGRMQVFIFFLKIDQRSTRLFDFFCWLNGERIY